MPVESGSQFLPVRLQKKLLLECYRSKILKLLLLHACGHLHDLLPQIAKTGLDGVESLTPPPTGNVELSYARKILGPDMTIIGGLDPIWFQQATPQEVEVKVEEIAKQVDPGRHFMLMPSDSTPAGVPLTNFKAVQRSIDRVAQWNRTCERGAIDHHLSPIP